MNDNDRNDPWLEEMVKNSALSRDMVILLNKAHHVVWWIVNGPEVYPTSRAEWLKFLDANKRQIAHTALLLGTGAIDVDLDTLPTIGDLI